MPRYYRTTSEYFREKEKQNNRLEELLARGSRIKLDLQDLFPNSPTSEFNFKLYVDRDIINIIYNAYYIHFHLEVIYPFGATYYKVTPWKHHRPTFAIVADDCATRFPSFTIRSLDQLKPGIIDAMKQYLENEAAKLEATIQILNGEASAPIDKDIEASMNSYKRDWGDLSFGPY